MGVDEKKLLRPEEKKIKDGRLKLPIGDLAKVALEASTRVCSSIAFLRWGLVHRIAMDSLIAKGVLSTSNKVQVF